MVYLFDSAGNINDIIRYCKIANIRNVSLCPITTDQTIISNIEKKLISEGNIRAEALPYLEYFNKKAFSERDDFINFVSEFSEKPIFGNVNFREYFKIPYSRFSLWFFSLISEKNPFKTDSYHNLIKLLAILELKDKFKFTSFLLDITDVQLSQALITYCKENQLYFKNFKKHRSKSYLTRIVINFLKAIKYYFYLLYRIGILAINTKNLNSRKKALKDAAYLAVTYFPLVDKKRIKEGEFVNKYYGLLQNAVESKYINKLVWLAMAPGIDGFSFAESVRLGRQLNLNGHPIYFLEEWISLRDLLLIPFQYIYFMLKTIIKISSASKKFRYYKYQVDIWKLFENDWFASFAGSILASNLFYLSSFENISNNLKSPLVYITYLAENQAWEKALNFTFSDKTNCKIVGIIHTAVPLLFLPYFDSEKDMYNLQANRFKYLACGGGVSLRNLRASRKYGEKAFLWFAIRYQHLREYLQKSIIWLSRQNKIVVVLSCISRESKELLNYIYQAFGDGRNIDYKVFIKAHYTLDIQRLISQLRWNFNKDKFVISRENLSSLLPTAKVMIAASSSASLESIAMGCPVIIPRLSSVVDLNPLSGISGLPIYVNSPKELRQKIDEIIESKHSPLSFENCRDFIKNYFEFPDSEDELLEKLYARN